MEKQNEPIIGLSGGTHIHTLRNEIITLREMTDQAKKYPVANYEFNPKHNTPIFTTAWCNVIRQFIYTPLLCITYTQYGLWHDTQYRLICTPDQPILVLIPGNIKADETKNKTKWIPAKDLTPDNRLVNMNGYTIVTDIKHYEADNHWIYQIQPSHNQTVVIENTIVVRT